MNNNIFLCVISLLLSFNIITHGQTYHDFGFRKDFSVKVYDSTGSELPQPWVGGLNNCMFSAIDLNFDGIKDLFVFDRHGDMALTFINQGTPGEVDFQYAPDYQIKFPSLKEWVNLVDYNNDGLEDIFTYTTGGIRVYKNVSDTEIRFKLEVSRIDSYYYNGYVNLFALVDDYPVFSDIDGDGDMDILNFFTLGKYVNYHKNLSMEKYSVCDSLDFILAHECWGYFEENETSNVVTLDIQCGFDNGPTSTDSKRDRHSGSSLLALDLDGDQVKDLLLGDVDFATIIGLINGGTQDSAHMISQDTLYPSYSKPIELMSLPLCCYLDVDNDEKRDLLVSPFDPGLDRNENLNSVWYYKNTGTDDVPYFEFQKENLFQDEMIDVGGGAYPVMYDIDQDGLQDLFISNFGYLDSTYYSFGFLYLLYRSQVAYYANTGTEDEPAYRLVDDDFADIASLDITGAYPAFSDLDGDNDPDMLLGNEDGKLFFLENLAGPGNVPQYDKPQPNYQGIDVGYFSTPQLIDLNRDGLPDLVIGEQSGNLNYYENSGTLNNPVFTFITDSLGKVDVTNVNLSYYGYSVPCFFDLDDDYRLFAGSEFGNIFYYKDIDDNIDGTFTLEDPNLLYIDEGWRTGVAVMNFNNDQYVDMLIGNYRGGVAMYKGVTPSPIGIHEQPEVIMESLHIFPNPAFDQMTVTGSRSAAVGSCSAGKWIEIYDIFGKQVVEVEMPPGQESITIDVSGYRNGFYMAVLRCQGQVVGREKFVVIH